jgi:peptidoglycan/LPS O-acetylase OafA/YrhL
MTIPAAARKSEMTAEHGTRRFGLDILRAAAIGLVVTSHYWSAVTYLGGVGVDLFFALSGFLIGGILLKMVERRGAFQAGDLVEFLRRRWYRTLPNYYLYLPIHFFLEPRSPGVPFVPPALGSYLVFLQNFAWPMPSTFYFITWSLCVEEWFYLLTAVTLFLLARAVGSRPRGARVAFGMTAAVLIVVPIALRFIPAVSQDPSWRTVVVVQIDSIMYGVLMAAARLYWPDLWRGPAAGVLLVLGAGAVLAARYLDPALSTPARALTPLGFACM